MAVLQRRRLEHQFVQVATAATGDASADDVASRVRAALDPLSGGLVGMSLVAAWWLFLGVVLIWSRTSLLEISRMADDSYLESLAATMSMRDLARGLSARLITASMVGIVGVPTSLLSFVVVDQMLVRPRSRWLDEVRRRVLIGRGASDGVDRQTAAVGTRAEARWNWTALMLNWCWLFAHGLGRRGIVALVAVVTGTAVGTLVGLGLGMQISVDQRIASGLPITLRELVWAPLLLTAMGGLPGWIVAMVVAARGQGWSCQHRQARGDAGPGSHEAVARRYRLPMVLVGMVLVGMVLVVAVVLAASWLPGRRGDDATPGNAAVAGAEPDSGGGMVEAVRPTLLE